MTVTLFRFCTGLAKVAWAERELAALSGEVQADHFPSAEEILAEAPAGCCVLPRKGWKKEALLCCDHSCRC